MWSVWGARLQQEGHRTFIDSVCAPDAYDKGAFAGDLGPYTPCFVDVALLGELPWLLRQQAHPGHMVQRTEQYRSSQHTWSLLNYPHGCHMPPEQRKTL